MRITNNYLNNIYLTNLNGNMEKLAILQERVASGKIINRPSDNPVQTSRLLDLKGRVGYIEQFQKNIDEGKALLEFTQATLNDTLTVVKKSYEISLKGADSALDHEERESLSFQVDQLLQEMLDLSRKKYQDKYLFGGTWTTELPYRAYTNISDESIVPADLQQPVQLSHDDLRKTGEFSIHRVDGSELQIGKDYIVNYEKGQIQFLSDGSATAGTRYSVSFSTYKVNFDVEQIVGVDENSKGIDDRYYQEIDEGITVAMNLTGREVFNDQVDLFQSLIDLRNRLSANDQEGVNLMVKETQSGIRQIMDNNALAGSKILRLNMTADRLVNNKTSVESLRSSIEDIDVAKAALDLQQLQNVYQAASYASRAIFESTLVNFLR